MMMGYQGWFLCEGDGSSPNEWRHWSHRLEKPNGGNLYVDMWPDMSEYTTTYSTNLTLGGENAKVFSSHDYSTTKLHFEWMRDYNVNGVYLQRFLSEVKDGRFFNVRNDILSNVIQASKETNRKFALMYDITDCDNADIYERMVADWNHVKNNYNPFGQSSYAKQENKPVIAIWGFGFDDGHHEFTNQKIADLIDFFKAEGCYVVGGVHGDWLTGQGIASNHDDWGWVYEKLNMITPWSVGSYGSNRDVDVWQAKIIADQNWCHANNRNIEYMPVIWPGFSWSNRYPGKKLNQIPRHGGDFYWHQAYKAIEANVDFLYTAMFDELDEATAMFKMVSTKEQLPDEAENILITLNQDNEEIFYPSDWYLQLADQVQLMLDGSTGLKSTIPISPNVSSPFLSDCDQLGNWTSSGQLKINTNDKKQGSASLEFSGSATDEFRQAFNTGYSSGIQANNAQLRFWYYVNDVDQLLSDGQIEIGSARKADQNEYSWSFSNLSLKNGWNDIRLDISDASTTNGSADLNNINWFRIYANKKGNIISRIDAIQIVNKNSQASVLDPCDVISGWETSPNSIMHINAVDQREGQGCLQFDGVGTNEFSKAWSNPVNAAVTVQTGYLKFWYYINDVSKITGDNQIEIGSAGKADTKEFHWHLTDLNLINGWNKVILPLATAKVTNGEPDLTNINWFRIYTQKSGVVKTIIDHIRFDSNPSADNFRRLAPTNESDIKVYPNPVTDNHIAIEIPFNNKEEHAYVRIFDINGNEVFHQVLSDDFIGVVDIGHLSRPSIYFLIVEYGGKTFNRRILMR
ncbi:T9SS type A sorting domain-containing protein [Persicobacter psychrovividus]